jgi:hypothetical protein
MRLVLQTYIFEKKLYQPAWWDYLPCIIYVILSE